MSIYEVSTPQPTALATAYRMAHEELRIVDLSGDSLESQRRVRREFGISVPLIAQIKAGRHLFSVLDTREDNQYASPLLVVDGSFKTSDVGYKGIWEDEPVMIGRRYNAHRFDYHPTVSGSHFSLAYEALGLVVKNHTPTNKTLLTGDLIDHRRQSRAHDKVRGHFTQGVVEDMQGRHDFGYADETAPYGYFRNHKIIGRLTRGVKDGVFFTPTSEAVVVDDKSRIIQKTTQDFTRKFERKFGNEPTVHIQHVLEFTNKYTRGVMPYDLEGAERLSGPHYGNKGLIGLSEYVNEQVGVCRHQCLVAAYLLEVLVENNQIMGTPRVERNHDVEAHGAHAWAVFDTPNNKTYVIDPAQNFVGTKSEAHAQGRWKYDLPVDQ